MFAEHYEQACQRIPRLPQVDTKRQVAEVVRAMINTLVIDLTETTRANIAKYQPDSVDAVRELPLLAAFSPQVRDRKSTRLNSSHVAISYAVFCLKKKIKN